MNTAIILTILMFVTPTVRANAEADPHHHQTVEEIGQLKERLKSLRDRIDSINRDTCQIGESSEIYCGSSASFRNNVKCATAAVTSPVTKRTTLEFPRKFETSPVVGVGITGLVFIFGADVAVTPLDIQKDSFQKQTKSDFISPLSAFSGYFGCPSKLNLGV
uniref:Uncharacterized protein n=1 Tax=Arion vulgaris TaxID=1028688 RepID=A0A0B7AZH5_9EUPU